MIFVRKCPVTGKVNEKHLPVTDQQYDDWIGGTLIQDAMPHLSASDREFIITGLLDETWDSVLPKEPE